MGDTERIELTCSAQKERKEKKFSSNLKAFWLMSGCLKRTAVNLKAFRLTFGLPNIFITLLFTTDLLANVRLKSTHLKRHLLRRPRQPTFISFTWHFQRQERFYWCITTQYATSLRKTFQNHFTGCGNNKLSKQFFNRINGMQASM